MKSAGILWSAAVIGAASAGLFTGLNHDAHSDISKFSAQLAQHERVPGEVIVKISRKGKSALHAQSLNSLLSSGRFSVASLNAFETNDSFYKVKLARDADVAEFLQAASQNAAVEYAEPNYILRAIGTRDSESDNEMIPNDTDFNKLWGMKNVGQKDAEGTVGVVGADIGATKAWKLATGNKEIVVAVIDTGVDYTHPDLADNIFVNTKEIAGNNIDDDGNGFVDDVRGWNFAGVSTNDPMDDNEHGTHCSGTIGGKGNDGRGVAGVNWTTSILPIKFLTGEGSGTLEDAVKSIQYATKMKAHVMSNSWGGGGFTQSMFDAITEAKNAGSLFIAAAGNDSQNSDSSPHYPAGYQIDNVIAVAASTNTDAMARFSTYGKRTVHLAAPGHKIYSTIPGNKYDTFSGTSMATPHVSGAAALLWGTDTSLTYAQIKERIVNSGDFIPSMSRKILSGRRLNVNNALLGVYPPSPEPAESAWRDYAFNGTIESKHPYDNSTRQEWTVEGPAEAKFMRVVFSKVDLETNYDFVKLFDASGAEMDSISGKSENQVSFYVTGNKMTIRLTSDSSINNWGFAIGKIQVVY